MKTYVVKRNGMNAQFEIEAESVEEASIKANDVSLHFDETVKTLSVTIGEIKVYERYGKKDNPLAPLIPAKD